MSGFLGCVAVDVLVDLVNEADSVDTPQDPFSSDEAYSSISGSAN